VAAFDDDRRAAFRFWAGVGAFFALMAVMLGLGWVCGADNPFGFVGLGKGKVPDLVGKDVCEASQAATARGLRWRYGGGGEVLTEALHADRTASFSCSDDEVIRQSPAAGTDLGEGGVVTLITVCSDPLHPVGCA
jgi:beta-lactam-binding protein with PASTA domain